MAGVPAPNRPNGAPGIAWPPVFDGRGAAIAALLRRLEATQWLAPDRLAALQREQLGLTAGFLAAHSLSFARRLHEAGLDPVALAAPGGLAALPPLRRTDLQHTIGLYSENVPARHRPVWNSHTAGSTGEPVMVKRTAMAQLYWSAVTVRDHIWHARDTAGGLAVVRAKLPRVAQHRNWGAPMILLFRTGPALTVPVSTDAAELHRHLADFAPANLLIYPNALAALVAHMETTGAELPDLRSLRTIGETLSPETRHAAFRVLGLQAADAYSTQEVGYIALQCPLGGLYHVMAETMIVEIVDANGLPCAPGESGRVLVTDLRNLATPLVRYETGDTPRSADLAPADEDCPRSRVSSGVNAI